MSLPHDSTDEPAPSIPLTRRHAIALAAAGTVAAVIAPAIPAAAAETEPGPECLADLMGAP
ncbi:hypothetical protein [Phytomonospora endophytica]|uniref:Uncharacterized protein n=1 Tax=Phytomonospora endophytica TaxID=714109 RepID=A0A841FKW7_9ACTN|nr:hypothetical protein [Phytomonospora endophytica]MBB6037981.1 hypothetical protein [Phytomonospora endophytica]GIG68880.1 hypothetical protein Pen01_51750 [Phytomonospora endophytica]